MRLFSCSRRWLMRAGPAALIAGCQNSPTTDPLPGRLNSRPSASPQAPSDRRGVVRLGGAANATLFIPVSYAPRTPAPFALVLHGAGGRGERILMRFADLAEQHGVILMSADSTGRTWDVVEAFSQRSSRPGFGPDPPRIDEALGKAFAQFAIDPARVSTVGISDGASYALSLAVYNPGLFNAVLAFSPGGVAEPPPGPRPRIFIAHGDRDGIIPVETTTQGIAPGLRQLGFRVDVEVFSGGHELRPQQVADGFQWWLRPDDWKPRVGRTR